MLNRIINWVKSIFHEETPEEQDKRIHETISNWYFNVDKEELARIDAYYAYCKHEALVAMGLALTLQPPAEVNPKHLSLWNEMIPHIKNKDNLLDAWTKWHTAHLFLASIYVNDVTPAKWLKDLALEENLIKTLQIEANAKEYEV